MTAGSAAQRCDHSVSFRSCEEFLGSAGRPSIQLNKNEVHVWGWTLDGSQECQDLCAGWLDPEERMRAARFIRDQDRRRFILAHGCLRVIISRYVDCPQDSVQFGRAQSGKPIIAATVPSPHAIEFNISHSQDRVIVGVADGLGLGIDLELIRPDTDVWGLAERFYSASERAALQRLPPADQRLAFFRYWVAKEAVLKGQGVGIPSLPSCEIVVEGGRSRAVFTGEEGAPLQSGWTVKWLSCGSGWASAVACRGEGWTVRSGP